MDLETVVGGEGVDAGCLGGGPVLAGAAEAELIVTLSVPALAAPVPVALNSLKVALPPVKAVSQVIAIPTIEPARPLDPS